MRVIHAPDQSWQYLKDHNIVFLAGSIEMGAAVDWQADVIARLEAWPDSERLVVLNPRRPDWDPSWEQDISNPLCVAKFETSSFVMVNDVAVLEGEE